MYRLVCERSKTLFRNLSKERSKTPFRNLSSERSKTLFRNLSSEGSKTLFRNLSSDRSKKLFRNLYTARELNTNLTRHRCIIQSQWIFDESCNFLFMVNDKTIELIISALWYLSLNI